MQDEATYPVNAPASPNVALFATCLVELFRPAIADAARNLVSKTGARVVLPREQTCCGQPNYNSGDRKGAIRMARHMITTLEKFDAVVAPSGSCAAMIRRHYPALFEEDSRWLARAETLASKTFELTDYLSQRSGHLASPPKPPDWGRITYHDGCSGLRELGVKGQPRALLGAATGCELTEMAEAERCCGFGGLFCVKYDAISQAMGRRKLESAERTGAPLLVAGELGCLMHLAGLAKRQGRRLECRHIVEILSGTNDMPAIGEPP